MDWQSHHTRPDPLSFFNTLTSVHFLPVTHSGITYWVVAQKTKAWYLPVNLPPVNYHLIAILITGEGGRAVITITNTSPAVAPSTLVLLLSGPYRNGVDYYHSGDRNGVRASVVTELITIKGGAVAVRIKSSHIPKNQTKHQYHTTFPLPLPLTKRT